MPLYRTRSCFALYVSLITGLFVSTPLRSLAEPPLSTLPAGDLLLTRTLEKIAYNPVHKQADWVSYSLSPARLRDCFPRAGSFRADPELAKTESAALSDYASSGFDRGHLLPAGDAHSASLAMKESFYLSNIAPQPPGYNRGIWKRLETLVRAWALRSEETWVATGPALNSASGSIGAGKVSTATAFYKALVSRGADGVSHGIAIYLPINMSGDLHAYTMSISRLQEITGLSFFTELSSEERSQWLDENRNEDWDFTARFAYLPCKPASFAESVGTLNLMSEFTRSSDSKLN